MSTIKDLLQEADPLRNEPAPSAEDRDLRRQAILAAASTPSRNTERFRLRMPVYVGALLILLVSFAAGLRLWPSLDNEVHAAVRFEVRVGEQNLGPGLKEAKNADGGRIYLHGDVIVTNSDIAEAKVIPQEGGSQYAILITFNPGGARKVREATEKNIGKRMAILIDGEIVTAPVIREATGEFAKIDSYSKQEAERIAAGMKIR